MLSTIDFTSSLSSARLKSVASTETLVAPETSPKHVRAAKDRTETGMIATSPRISTLCVLSSGRPSSLATASGPVPSRFAIVRMVVSHAGLIAQVIAAAACEESAHGAHQRAEMPVAVVLA
jgi:hypothetical protein